MDAVTKVAEQALQNDLDQWLVHYNTERPHLGYRNQGTRPLETNEQFASQDGWEDKLENA